jgi:hypothetical protein
VHLRCRNVADGGPRYKGEVPVTLQRTRTDGGSFCSGSENRGDAEEGS